MYKEETVTCDARAKALIAQNFLWHRDSQGKPHLVTSESYERLKGIATMFACSHATPRTIPPFDVKLLIGAHAYACIAMGNRKVDIRLSPGKSAPDSLREYAQEQRDRAAHMLAMAEIAERAAESLA